MKTILKFTGISICLIPVILMFSACEEENMAPAFISFFPEDNHSCEKGDIISVFFEATDGDGTIQELKLEIDGNLVNSSSSEEIYYDWDTKDALVGAHEITATATDDLGKEGKKTINITVDPIFLTVPGNITVGEYEGKLFISWDFVPKALSYTIYWTDDGSGPGESGNKIEGITDTYYTHENLDFTRTYKYKLIAVSGEFTSLLSVEVSGTPKVTPLDIPANVNAEVTDGSVKITWDPVDFEGVVYNVERKCPAIDFYFSTIAEDINTTEFMDNTIDPGKGYFYQVYATDNTYNRQSSDSDPAYAATMKTVYESERNNENTSTTLTYDTHYYDAEESTEELDWFRVKGGYSGAYSIYSSYSYRNYDADCFLIYLEDGDGVQFSLISGNMNDLWSMTVSVIEYGHYSSGNDREVQCHEFTAASTYFTYDKSNTGTVSGTYLKISMWEDLVNYGPYNYEVEIKIIRNP